MTITDLVADTARALHAAHRDRTPIPPLSAAHPELTIDDAYRIQSEMVGMWLSEGRVLRGRKVGLTALPMQKQLGVDQPDFGVLMGDMIHQTGVTLSVDHFISPRVEPELAIVLGADVPGGASPRDILPAIQSVAPALEIIDTRIADWKIGIVDTIADNASSGAVVVGRPVDAVDIDFRGMGCIFRRNGDVVDTGAGGAVLGSPIVAVAWLANTLAQFGDQLRAGDVILPGSMTGARFVTPGESWSAEMSGVGTVAVHFSGRTAS